MQRCNHCGFLNPDQTQHCQNCHKTIELTRYVKTDNKYNIPQKLNIQPGHLFLAETEKYVVEKEIGSGGFGTVYLVKNSTNSQFALKLLHLWEINPEEHQEIQGRFTREYKRVESTLHLLFKAIILDNWEVTRLLLCSIARVGTCVKK